MISSILSRFVSYGFIGKFGKLLVQLKIQLGLQVMLEIVEPANMNNHAKINGYSTVCDCYSLTRYQLIESRGLYLLNCITLLKILYHVLHNSFHDIRLLGICYNNE